VPDISHILDRLKQLQDTAGNLHDIHLLTDEVMAAAQRAGATHAKRLATAVFKGDLSGVAQTQRENPIPGILALAARLREREAHCFEILAREWLDGAADDLFNHVHAVADTLRAAASSYSPLNHGG
jgi:acyl-CoA reductase-like NAD-dependent aldehyde dehydrogenase